MYGWENWKKQVIRKGHLYPTALKVEAETGRARSSTVRSFETQLCDRIQFLEAQLSNFRGCFVARRVSLCPTQLIKKRTHKKIICAKRQKNKKENKKSI
jgi:hypothetical protein